MGVECKTVDEEIKEAESNDAGEKPATLAGFAAVPLTNKDTWSNPMLPVPQEDAR